MKERECVCVCVCGLCIIVNERDEGRLIGRLRGGQKETGMDWWNDSGKRLRKPSVAWETKEDEREREVYRYREKERCTEKEKWEIERCRKK